MIINDAFFYIALVFLIALFAVIVIIQEKKWEEIEKQNKELLREMDEKNKNYQYNMNITENANWKAHEEGKQRELLTVLKHKKDDRTAANITTSLEEERALLLVLIVKRSERKAKAENVEFSVIMNGTRENEAGMNLVRNLDDRQIIGVFTNLLDNAIEAAARTENSRYVRARLNVGSFLIENGKLENSHPMETGFLTSKDDPVKHGIGTRVIRSIVDEKKLKLKYHDFGQIFRTELTVY